MIQQRSPCRQRTSLRRISWRRRSIQLHHNSKVNRTIWFLRPVRRPKLHLKDKSETIDNQDRQRFQRHPLRQRQHPQQRHRRRQRRKHLLYRQVSSFLRELDPPKLDIQQPIHQLTVFHCPLVDNNRMQLPPIEPSTMLIIHLTIHSCNLPIRNKRNRHQVLTVPSHLLCNNKERTRITTTKRSSIENRDH